MRKTDPGMSPFWDYIGMREVELKEGESELRIEVTKDLLQRRGSVHGGVLATLLDASIGSAVRTTLSEEEASVTVELKINYIKPAKGSYLIGKGKVSHRGKTLAVGSAEIWDEQGKLVAMGTGTYIVLKKDGR